MQQMDIVTQQNAQMVESTNQTAAKLQTEAKIMQSVINRFQVRREQKASEPNVSHSVSEENEAEIENPQAELLALPEPQ
jgi:hypothetical protein